MSLIVDSIFTEWRASLPEGSICPNTKNGYHLFLLKEICLKRGISENIINSVILALEVDDKEPPLDDKEKDRAKKMGLVWKGKGYGKENDDFISFKNVDGKLKPVEPKKTGKEKKTDTKISPTFDPKTYDAETGTSPYDPKNPKPQVSAASDEDAQDEGGQGVDQEKIDTSLEYTKTQYNIDKQTGGREGIGLGTNKSRAGEAAVHKGLRMMMDGKSLDEINSHLMDIANDSDTYLNKGWVNAAMSTIQAVDREIGIKNIKFVSGDTPEGRTSVKVDTDLETSSDMFIRTNDGRTIGVSLKDSGDVFLANKGWPKQSAILLDELESQMDTAVHGQLSKAMSIDNFKQKRSLEFRNVLNQMGGDFDLMVQRLQNDPSNPIGDYVNEFNDLPKLKNAINTDSLSIPQMKAIARMLAVYDKEKEQKLRNPEKEMVKDTFDVLNSSIEAKRGMNKWILRNMHVFDALGLNKEIKDGGVDEFITVFGTKPKGSVMKEDSIRDLFGSEVTRMLTENLNEIRNGNMEPEELENYMADKMELDHETGRISFLHENNLKYPLFYLAGRSRGIGESPAMEIHSTPMFERSLEAGTFNTDNWSEEQLNRLNNDFREMTKRNK